MMMMMNRVRRTYVLLRSAVSERVAVYMLALFRLRVGELPRSCHSVLHVSLHQRQSAGDQQRGDGHRFPVSLAYVRVRR